MSLIFLAEMRIIGNINTDIIIVDRVAYKPVPAGIAISEVFFSTALSIRKIYEAIWNSYADKHAVRFLSLMIFIWPPEAAAGALHGKGYPGISAFSLPPSQPPVPGRLSRKHRLARRIKPECTGGSPFYFFREIDKYSIVFPLPFQGYVLPQNTVHLHVLEKIHLNTVKICQCLK